MGIGANLSRSLCAVSCLGAIAAVSGAQAAPYADPGADATASFGFFGVKGFDPSTGLSIEPIQPLVAGGPLNARTGDIFADPVAFSATQELAAMNFEPISPIILSLVMETGSVNDGVSFSNLYDRSVVTDPASSPGTETGAFVFEILETTNVDFTGTIMNGTVVMDFDIEVSDPAGFYDTVMGSMRLMAQSEIMGGDTFETQLLSYDLEVTVPGPAIAVPQPAVLGLLTVGLGGIGLMCVRRQAPTKSV